MWSLSKEHDLKIQSALREIEKTARMYRRDPFRQMNTPKQKEYADLYLNKKSELSLMEPEENNKGYDPYNKGI